MQTVKANMVPQLLALYLEEQPVHKHGKEHIITATTAMFPIWHAREQQRSDIL